MFLTVWTLNINRTLLYTGILVNYKKNEDKLVWSWVPRAYTMGGRSIRTSGDTTYQRLVNSPFNPLTYGGRGRFKPPPPTCSFPFTEFLRQRIPECLKLLLRMPLKKKSFFFVFFPAQCTMCYGSVKLVQPKVFACKRK